MNVQALYAKFEADYITNAMPKAAADAWMAAGDNAMESHPVDSALFKAATLDSLSMTSAFEASAEVRAYFEAAGYTW